MNTITKKMRAPKPVMPLVDITDVMPAIVASFKGIDDRDKIRVYSWRESCGGVLAAIELARWTGREYVPGQHIVFVRMDGTVAGKQTHWNSCYWIGLEAFNAFDPVAEFGAVPRAT